MKFTGILFCCSNLPAIFAVACLPVGKFFSIYLSRKAEGNGPMKP